MVRKDFHLGKDEGLSLILWTIDLLDDVVVVVGQVETNSLVLFFIGNEKSLRGQQLTSMLEKKNVYDDEDEDKEKTTNECDVCMFMEEDSWNE